MCTWARKDITLRMKISRKIDEIKDQQNVESGTVPSTDAFSNKPAETKVPYVKALPIVTEDFLGSKGYKLPSRLL